MVELSINQMWRSGPEWLELDVPVNSSDSVPMPESSSQELKLKAIPSHNSLTVENTNYNPYNSKDYSDLQELLRVTVHVHRAVKQFKVKRSL